MAVFNTIIEEWRVLLTRTAQEMLPWPRETRRLFLKLLLECYCQRCGGHRESKAPCACAARKD